MKRHSFRRIIRHQLDLPDILISFQHRLKQRSADALSLSCRVHQNILHKHNGGTIAHHPHNAEQFPVFICRQNKQRIFVPALQCRHIFRIRGPANLRIQLQNFIGLEFSIFFYFHVSLRDS